MKALVASPVDAARRPRLELSGPKLSLALETLVAASDDQVGVERYVTALKAKAAAFRAVLGDGKAMQASLRDVRDICACMATVRRRAGAHLSSDAFGATRRAIAALLDGAGDTATADARIAAFCAAFPAGRDHRWVRDFAAEVLHNVDPERYPPMCRWVWDANLNTGVLREIWHGDDVDHTLIDVPDRYETFVVLREELAQFLAANGVYRDVVQYVDLLLAQVYATYLSEQGGSYLRADFASREEPMLHVRRLLGLDGVAASGRTRLKAVDGTASVVDAPRLSDQEPVDSVNRQ